jgi:hypothetical protein
MKNLIKSIGSQSLISIAISFFIIISGILAFQEIAVNKTTDRSQALESVLRQAAIQCYALEGSYPPDLEYLNTHYGIILDEAQYYFFYDIQGGNILPKIAVIKR